MGTTQQQWQWHGGVHLSSINISKHADSYWLLLQIEWQDVKSGAQGNPIDS